MNESAYWLINWLIFFVCVCACAATMMWQVANMADSENSTKKKKRKRNAQDASDSGMSSLHIFLCFAPGVNYLKKKKNSVCLCGSCGVRSTTLVLLQWHTKDPDHSARSAGGRLHLNTHTSWTQQSLSRLSMPLSRHSVGTHLIMSSHTTCQGILGYIYLSLLSHCGLILA